jgi:threonine/homoserine efflux transporter RhtA
MAWTTPGTATAGEVLTAAFWNEQVRDNLIELAPFSAEWQSYTPTFTNFTLGNGTVTARYLKVGKNVAVQVSVVLGSTSAMTGDLRVGLPFSASQGRSGIWDARLIQAVVYTGFVVTILPDLNTAAVRAVSAAGTYASQVTISSTIPETWTTGHGFSVNGFYEAV